MSSNKSFPVYTAVCLESSQGSQTKNAELEEPLLNIESQTSNEAEAFDAKPLNTIFCINGMILGFLVQCWVINIHVFIRKIRIRGGAYCFRIPIVVCGVCKVSDVVLLKVLCLLFIKLLVLARQSHRLVLLQPVDHSY